MPDLNDFDNATNIDLGNLVLFIRNRSLRTALTLDEFIQTALNQGMDRDILKQTLLKDLEEGGRIFGEFRRSIKATANGTMNNFRDSAQWAEEVDVQKFMWVAVLTNTCPDCLPRHGDIKPMEEWEQEGLPRSGFSVCKDNCKCILVDARKTLLKPILRGQAQEAKERVKRL